MDEDLSTLEGALNFLARIHDEAQRLGVVTLRPAQFIRAVRSGMIEYKADTRGGVSINGSYVGEYAPKISGAPVLVLE